MGAIKLLQKTTTSRIIDSYKDYYLKVINDFLKNGYYKGKVSNDDFKNVEINAPHNYDAIFAIADKIESCADFINIGNLNTMAFICKEDKKITWYLESASELFISKVQENPINYFTPVVLSKASRFSELGNRIQQHVSGYVIFNTMVLTSLKQKLGVLYNPEEYLNAMLKHKFVQDEGQKFVEAFISVYMYGIGGLKAIKSIDQMLELQNMHSLQGSGLVVDYSCFHLTQDWDKKTIEAYKLNPQLIEFVERFVQPSKRLMLSFTNHEEFLGAHKGYFVLQILAQAQLEADAVLNLYDEYHKKHVEQNLETMLYCTHVIRSYIETDTALIYTRTLECVAFLYNKVPNIKPTFSVL